MKKLLKVLIFSICVILVTAGKKQNKTSDDELGDILNNYFKTLSEEGALDYTIILTSNQYYDDGTIQQVDAIAFSSQAEDDTVLKNFNLSSLNKKSIKKLVDDAEKEGVMLSLYQENKVDDVTTEEDFGTPQLLGIPSAAANVVLHPDGFVAGLEEEIRDAMDLTENVATIQVLEYFEEGLIKRNTTTNVYSNKVNVIDSHKMPPRMIQTSAELLRKAYKIDMDDRAPFISQLFEKEYPKYKWEVLANSTAPVAKKDVSVTLTAGQDKYDIVGVLQK